MSHKAYQIRPEPLRVCFRRMEANGLILASVRSLASLAPVIQGMDSIQTELDDIARATARGYFTPDEDERVRTRFAGYLAARAALLSTIEELRPLAMTARPDIDDESRLRAFAVAYAATAMLVRAGRFIVERFAPNKVVQRKLNEAEQRFGIPRKQFTSIYRSLTNPLNAWRIYEANQFLDLHRSDIEAMRQDSHMCQIIQCLHDAEPWLRMSKRRYAAAYARYRWHSWRRRRASAFGQAMFAILEMSGRIVADLRNPWHVKRVSPPVQEQLANVLQPGDVLLSRHDDAASNLFLPGYWVHASLHIGPEEFRREMKMKVDSDRESRWLNPIRVLEAKKDGVRFRPLNETLAVDAVLVLRPRLGRAEIATAIEQAVTHEGKLYDFEFDFFRSDRMVCTEVVYRGYHKIGGIEFQLSRRAGRPTLSAEDILQMAMRGNGFEPVAVFGPEGATERVLLDDECVNLLRSSAKNNPSHSESGKVHAGENVR